MSEQTNRQRETVLASMVKEADAYTLPTWEELPDFGLYMEQVVTFLRDKLKFLDDGSGEEPIITAAAINNHVRKKVIPQPIKKRYYRRNLAFLVMLCSLKNALSIADIQKIIPVDMEDDALHTFYEAFLEQYGESVQYFIKRLSDMRFSGSERKPIIIDTALLASFCGLLSKILVRTEDNAGQDED